MALLKKSIESSTNLIDEFRESCLEVGRIIGESGIFVRPFASDDLSIFSGLDLSKKKEALDRLNVYKKICNSTVVAGHGVADSKTHIWYAIQAFGLRPTSDLFDYIEDGHVVEIHDPTGIQIFRNSEFYKFSSYSLEEFYCRPWENMFSHEKNNTQKILEKAQILYGGKTKNVIPFDIDEHVIEEISSSCRLRIKASIEWGAALFDSSGQVMATIVLERGLLLNPENDIYRPKPYFGELTLLGSIAADI